MARRVSGRSSSGFAPLWRASLLSLTVVATVLCLSIAMATPAAAGRPGPHGLGKPWHGLGLGLCSRALHSYSNSYSNRNSYRNSDSDRNSDSCSSRGVVARSSRQRSSQTDAEEVHVVAAGGGATASASEPLSLSYFQTMTAGALSRTMAQTLMHPAITYKTVLQLRHRVGPGQAQPALTFERLLRGVDAQFLLSLPHGAFHFFVIDRVKAQLTRWLPQRLDAMADFSASAISTVICSVVSTPQMVLTDRLMAGVYPSFPHALRAIMAAEGWKGFYTGWWPALAQKIPSYGLTWMFFQQLKRAYERWPVPVSAGANTDLHSGGDSCRTRVRTVSNEWNFVMGALAAAASVTIMIPVDTVKTRLVTQICSSPESYRGMTDCFLRMLREEGLGSFYRALGPRLLSVVPMMAIQFGVYEGIKSKFMEQKRMERQRVRILTQQHSLKSSRISSVSSPVSAAVDPRTSSSEDKEESALTSQSKTVSKAVTGALDGTGGGGGTGTGAGAGRGLRRVAGVNKIKSEIRRGGAKIRDRLSLSTNRVDRRGSVGSRSAVRTMPLVAATTAAVAGRLMAAALGIPFANASPGPMEPRQSTISR